MCDGENACPIVTLLTDFGQEDAFVGTMKGVILRIAPRAHIVDLTHAIPPQDIEAAAFQLSAGAPYFPFGAIHVVVVDPGVGSERRPIAVRTRRAHYVGPDNGVLDLALREDPPMVVVRLDNPEYHLPSVSRTFHGRDIFAPAAAHLARGIPCSEIGSALTDIVHLPWPFATEHRDGRIEGEIVYMDHFGNCITNIKGERVEGWVAPRFAVAGRTVERLSDSYAENEEGNLLAIVGSSGYVELAVRNGSAAAALAVDRGTPVVCEAR